MWQQIIPALRINLFMTAVLGIAYPLAVTGVCQVLFPHQSSGSLAASDGRVIGSELIGQNFTRAEYFHPRPSAAGDNGYDGSASGGSNLGPTSRKLVDRVKTSVAAFRAENPTYSGPVPADAVTASASGLDPHVSPASALAQCARVAAARRATLAQLEALVTQFTEKPDWGILGGARVNVLRLNMAVDREFPMAR
jgi:potassium-transporting ATPase KdpC subunit